MTRNELNDLLNQLEQHFPVGSWTLDGIDIWPVLKIRLFFFNYNRYLDKDTTSREKSIKPSFGKTALQILQSFVSFKYKKITQSDIMVVDALSHYGMHDGIRINKYFYPLEIAIQQLRDAPVKWLRAMYGGRIDNSIYKADEILDINHLADFYRFKGILWRKIFYKKANVALPGLEGVHAYLLEHKLSPSISLSAFQNFIGGIIDEIESYRKVFRKILKSSKPKVILEICYYTPQNYALNIEAKKSNIPTIEIMHGGMGEQHVAYAGWSHVIPQGGYNVMPEKIWVWDQNSKQLLDQWMDTQSFHQSFVGGLPWLDYLIALEENKDALRSDKKVIIYTLQYEQIDDYIYDAINRTPDDYEWWLRLHPRKMYAKEGIIRELNHRGIEEKVNINDANAIPLPIILQHCHLHISECSGSIIEAAILGKTSIILNTIGVESNYQYVKEGLCIPVLDKNATSLVAVITKDVNTAAKKSNTKNYMDIVEQLILPLL